MSPEYTISVVIFEEKFEDNCSWVAQCLEYDIATQAKSLKDLYYEIERILIGHMVVSAELGVKPFDNIPAAPQEFWDRYEGSKLRVEGDRLPFRLPNTVAFPLPIPELRVG